MKISIKQISALIISAIILIAFIDNRIYEHRFHAVIVSGDTFDIPQPETLKWGPTPEDPEVGDPEVEEAEIEIEAEDEEEESEFFQIIPLYDEVFDISADIEDYLYPDPFKGYRVTERISLGWKHITGYDSCPSCCGKLPDDPLYGITSSGTVATVGRTVASLDIPTGTMIYIEAIGIRVVEDTGYIKNGIDVFVKNHEDAMLITGDYEVFIVTGYEIDQ